MTMWCRILFSVVCNIMFSMHVKEDLITVSLNLVHLFTMKWRLG